LFIAENAVKETEEEKIMKAVLISIQPKWCELIASGKKTIEVRKTKPKIEPPFKCYIYCTHSKNGIAYCKGNEILNGKVIGEFVCDKIERGHILWVKEQPEYYDQVEEKTRLTYRQMFDYLGENGVGYFWHISDLVIYDEPKPLSHLSCECKHYDADSDSFCYGCQYFYVESNESVGYYSECLVDGYIPVKKPPQSWCYVEEV
jgi:predicted transcriptional regulator